MMMMERTFVCSDGFKLAAQVYSPATTKASRGKVLLLHGWLDNCRTFWKLAPALAESREVVALDFPGHGLSDHRPKEAPSILLNEAVYSVAEVLQQMRTNKEEEEEEKVTLIGHSMGGAISLAYAATFPEQVDRLVLIESLGPLSRPQEDITQHLKKHIETRLMGNAAMYGENPRGPRVHASIEAAIETRMKTATLSPGNQYISRETANELVTRATKPAGDGVQFTHDYRLTWPSLMYTTPGQVGALQEAVTCPTLLILAEDGWPIDQERLDQGKKRINPQHSVVLPGSHHLHADPDHCDAVTEQILKFLDDDDDAGCDQ